jgi:hypothetical protein
MIVPKEMFFGDALYLAGISVENLFPVGWGSSGILGIAEYSLFGWRIFGKDQWRMVPALTLWNDST